MCHCSNPEGVGHDTPVKQGDNCLQPISENVQQYLKFWKNAYTPLLEVNQAIKAMPKPVKKKTTKPLDDILTFFEKLVNWWHFLKIRKSMTDRPTDGQDLRIKPPRRRLKTRLDHGQTLKSWIWKRLELYDWMCESIAPSFVFNLTTFGPFFSFLTLWSYFCNWGQVQKFFWDLPVYTIDFGFGSTTLSFCF